jgi:hypothetical protein
MIPISNVKTGLRELSILARELLICVCASGKRYAGIPLPR